MTADHRDTVERLTDALLATSLKLTPNDASLHSPTEFDSIHLSWIAEKFLQTNETNMAQKEAEHRLSARKRKPMVKSRESITGRARLESMVVLN